MNHSDQTYGACDDFQQLANMPLNDPATGAQIADLFGFQDGDLPLPQSQESFSLGSLSFSQGTWEAIAPGPDANFNNYPVTTVASEMGNFPPAVIGDDEFLSVREMGMSAVAPRSIIGNKFNGKKVVYDFGSAGTVGTEAFGYNMNQEEDVSSSQSSDISQEAKIPSLDPYPGKYNFVVKLGQNTNKKTAVYSAGLNRLYCNNDVKILFNLHMDSKGKSMKDFMVKSEVVFSENTHIMEPVQRCITCLHKEAKAERIDFNSISEDSILHHVIRDHHQDARHERNAQQRYYTLASLERPQLGAGGGISRNYEFKCLNTCFVEAKKRLNVIFSLMENNKPVGRSVMALKICSCPVRDYNNDKKRTEKTVKIKSEPRKRRAGERAYDQVEEEEKLDEPGVMQKQRCVSPPPMNTLSIKAEPGVGEVKGNDRKGLFSQQSNSEPDDSEADLSQGQAGSQDSFCSRTLHKIAPDIKMAYELKKTGDEKDKVVADTLFGLLKTFHRTSEKYKKTVSSPKSGAAAREQEPAGHGSPDSGVNAKTP